MSEHNSDEHSGLTELQAQQQLSLHGFNELPKARQRTLLRIALEVMQEPMFLLLLAAGSIYLMLGDLGEALVLLAAIAATIGITIGQDRRSERVLEALHDLTSPRALVIRDGQRRRIPGREVVRGDVIVLSEGDRVPADAWLLSASNLQVDESLLTGESMPVNKVVRDGPRKLIRAGGEDLPLVFSGTLIVRGHGLAHTLAIGMDSEIGKIGLALKSIRQEPTPLTLKTRRVVKAMATIGLSLCLVIMVLYGVLRHDWFGGVLAGITMAMSLLPDEIPLVLTVFMVMGAWRLAQHRVLTRRAATIETLGAATVLCTDKTGTLTQNRMAVAELSVNEQTWRIDQDELPEEFHGLLEFAILASMRDPHDPMERALHTLGEQHLAGTEHLHGQWALAHEYGLSPSLLAMSHVWKALEHQDFIIAAKGSPEAIADLCHLDAATLARVEQSAHNMAARGLRVLGVAKARFHSAPWPGSQHDFEFDFLGLVGLADPLRPSACAAVQQCTRAGIKVAMITGDHPVTALAIAADAGIDTSGGVITGDDLQSMDDSQLRQRLAKARVFARIMPEQKLRIVNAFKANGEIVAMTGDGVNDAPSLKAAHIGIAMGGRGTDVAREAAGMVLLDDDFGTLVTAVKLGRRIYDNLRKAMAFIFAVHVPIAGLALLPLLLGWPLVFSPIHIAFLELVIDPVCSFVFESETEEANAMQRPPRNSSEPLISWHVLSWSLFQGALVLGAIMVFIVAMRWAQLPEAETRTATFVSLVIADFGLILVNRSLGTSLLATLTRPNRALWQVCGVTLSILAVAVLFVPAQQLFHFGPVSPLTLMAAVTVGITVMFVLMMIKRCWPERALVNSY